MAKKANDLAHTSCYRSVAYPVYANNKAYIRLPKSFGSLDKQRQEEVWQQVIKGYRHKAISYKGQG